MRQIQGKLALLLVSGEFELPRVRVIGLQLHIDFKRSLENTVACVTSMDHDGIFRRKQIKLET